MSSNELNITPEEARAIAKDAYIYGFPMVDNYRIQYSYFINEGNPEYKAPWNQISNTARVYTPDDKVVQTPNSDTPYSTIGADLRAEPLVLTFPPVERSRYFSAQFVDAYTFNFAYVSSRTAGNNGGSYLLAGPNWKGETPGGVKSVIQAETEFVLVLYRTQLFKREDIENVKKIQAGYRVQTLSQFQGRPAPPQPPRIDFPKPLSTGEERNSLELFSLLNFILRHCPTHPSEQSMMTRFAKLNIGPLESFHPDSLSPELRKAVEDGIADAWKEYERVAKLKSSGDISIAELFGTRVYLKNNYLYRMMAAADGIYGNSKEEAVYFGYSTDSTSQALDGKNHYTLRFAAGRLPPANAFWSLTMYTLPSSLLVPNSLKRYLVNSPMVPDLKRDNDGGITLYIQHDSPGTDSVSNWLPAPDGPFLMALRLYWPKPEAIDGRWKKPPLERTELHTTGGEWKKAG